MTFTQHKWFNALLILALMLGTMGITSAAAKCDPQKNPNCPTEAPGQQPADTPTSDSVTVVSGTLVNNGGQVVNGNGNGVVNQALQGTNNATVTIIVSPDTVLNLPEDTNATVIVEGAEVVTASQASPGVVSSASQGNKPAGADCSSLQGTALTPPAETITAQQLHDMLNWGWKDGPVGGRNRIRATNVCISNGGNGNWTNNLPEPANSVNDIASWKKLQRWADLYNAGQLVIFTQ
jgi:hypothetical protein